MKVVATRRACATAVPALLALLALAPPGLAATPTTSPAKKAAPAGKPAAGRLSPVMPDSVLAKVFLGTGAGQMHLVVQRDLNGALARAGRRLDGVTPQERRQFLEVLIDRVVLVARVKQEPRRWDHRDSTDWNTLRDRLVLRAALDSAMIALNAERMSRGDSVLNRQEMGVLLREQAVRAMAPRWNDAALRKAVSVFDTLPRPTASMSMLEQMRVAGMKPRVNPTDSALVLVESTEGAYTLGELVRDFGRLNPIYRPRITKVEDVQDLVGNALFEARLRRAGLEGGLEHRPSIATQLAERAEYLDIAKFVSREVYAKIAQDSVTLQRHFKATRSQYDWDERASILSLVMGTHGEADSVRRVLMNAAEAETLIARSTRAGASFRTTITRASDTTLFARLKKGGVGAVLGPDSTSQGWRTMRALAFEPRRPRTYAEAEDLVKQDWYNVEGERLMRSLLDGLRERALVVVNEKAMRAPQPASNVKVIQ